MNLVRKVFIYSFTMLNMLSSTEGTIKVNLDFMRDDLEEPIECIPFTNSS